MPYTLEECKAWIAAEMDGIMRGLENSKDVPRWLKESGGPVREHFLNCWKSGCWLNFVNRENGATEEEVFKIGFAHGSRCAFLRNPDPNAYLLAVAYANAYKDEKFVPDTVTSNFRIESPGGTTLVARVDEIPNPT